MGSIRAGCVIFDDPDRPSVGWAACGGGAKRIGRPSELSSDIVWITNLDREGLYRTGLSNHANFRERRYFSEDAETIAAMLNVSAEDTPSVAENAAIIFNRTLNLAADLFRMEWPPPYSLEYGIRRALYGEDPVFPDKWLTEGLEESVSHFVRCQTPAFDKRAIFRKTYRLLKMQHALNVLSNPTPSPSGRWKSVRPPKENRLLEWAMTKEAALCAQVTVHGFSNADIGRLVNFGSFSKRRRWVTSPDLVVLLGSADVSVHRLYVSEDTVVPLSINEALSAMTPEWGVSLSANLLAESVWLAFTKRFPPPAHVLRDKFSVNPMTPFIKGYDRLICMEKAMDLERKEEATTISYGRGKIDMAEVETGTEASKLVHTFKWTSVDAPSEPEADRSHAVALDVLASRDASLILDVDMEFIKAVL